MRIVYKGNYIRMTCGEIGLVVLVQPRKTRPYITERLLMGRKEPTHANKAKAISLNKQLVLSYTYLGNDKDWEDGYTGLIHHWANMQLPLPPTFIA